MDRAARHGPRTSPDPRGLRPRRCGAVKDRILRMGSLVEEAIRDGRRGASGTTPRGPRVIEGDGRINAVQARLCDVVVTTGIATQAAGRPRPAVPVALDHVALEFERIGDHASSVAKQVRGGWRSNHSSGGTHPAPDGPPRCRQGPRHRRGPGRRRRWSAPARSRLATTRSTSSTTPSSTSCSTGCGSIRRPSIAGPGILFSAHYLERIGDRVTNVAEDVLFLAGGVVEDLN